MLLHSSHATFVPPDVRQQESPLCADNSAFPRKELKAGGESGQHHVRMITVGSGEGPVIVESERYNEADRSNLKDFHGSGHHFVMSNDQKRVRSVSILNFCCSCFNLHCRNWML